MQGMFSQTYNNYPKENKKKQEITFFQKMLVKYHEAFNLDLFVSITCKQTSIVN